MIDFDFKLPLEYESFKYLHVHLGDIGTVEAVCKVWNQVKVWQNNSLRIKEVNEQLGQIILTGRCVDTEQAVLICKYLTSHPISIKYEKTIMTIDIEV